MMAVWVTLWPSCTELIAISAWKLDASSRAHSPSHVPWAARLPPSPQRRRGGEIGEKNAAGWPITSAGVVTEDQLGRSVETLDAAAVIDGDDSFGRGFDDRVRSGEGGP